MSSGLPATAPRATVRGDLIGRPVGEGSALRRGIRKEAVYVALGVTQEGRREALGFYLFPEESALIWPSEVLRDLWERRVHEVLKVVNDDPPGMEEAIRRTFPAADWRE